MTTLPLRPSARVAGAALALAAVAAFPLAASAAIDVGVSIGISQPGVYGRIDIGRFPQPQVVVAQPVVVVPSRQPRTVPPVYMWVPPGHRMKWSKHCQAYGACGVPVVFVRDEWYEQNVMPDDHRRGGGHPGKGRGKGRGKDKH